jgi:hypothetical protein
MKRPTWRRFLMSRFVVVPATIVLTIALWNLYVSTHDHGYVRGLVVDSGGNPVANATVVLWVLNFTTFVEKATATTGSDGRFVLINLASHHIQVGAEKAGAGRSERVRVRLYFRAQDVQLREPLVLRSG